MALLSLRQWLSRRRVGKALAAAALALSLHGPAKARAEAIIESPFSQAATERAEKEFIQYYKMLMAKKASDRTPKEEEKLGDLAVQYGKQLALEIQSDMTTGQYDLVRFKWVELETAMGVLHQLNRASALIREKEEARYSMDNEPLEFEFYDDAIAPGTYTGYSSSFRWSLIAKRCKHHVEVKFSSKGMPKTIESFEKAVRGNPPKVKAFIKKMFRIK